jgi:hypothetical protein
MLGKPRVKKTENARMRLEGKLLFLNAGKQRLLEWSSIIAFVLAALTIFGCSESSAPTATSVPTPTRATQLEDTLVAPGGHRKMLVSGFIVDGGDTTPEGLLDAPRKFIFKIEKEDGSFVFVTYTAFPPSPVSTREAHEISLDFHAGEPLIGDYLVAQGSYDQSTNTLTVAQEGDYIKTYPEKPN